MVEIFYEDTEILDLSPEFFVLWLRKVLKEYDKELGDVNLIFTSDDYLLAMNKEHLNHDYYTDIITFNFNEEDVVSGDLFISVDRVKDNADSIGESFNNELYRVVAHGVLHLTGLNDKTEVERVTMRTAEDKALEFIVSRET